MKNRHKAMTLLEVIITVAILAIFLSLASNTLLRHTFSAGDDFSSRADLRQGVTTTLENVQNQIKNSTQVHLVDKTVFDPNLTVSEMNRRLDKRYKYISLGSSKDGDKEIYDIEYKNSGPNKGSFEKLPIISSISDDMLKSRDIKYKIELYKNDKNYKEKMQKKIVNITVTGKVKGQKPFSLSKDVTLSNVNQIMFSRFFTGDLDDITAIAYDKFAIKAEEAKAKSSATVVLALDNSGSMVQNLNGNRIYSIGATLYRVYGSLVENGEKHPRKKYDKKYVFSKKLLESEDAPRKYIAGEAANKNFLDSLSAIAKRDDIDMKVYIFNFNEDMTYSKKDTSRSGKYLYPLEILTRYRYGPYNLKNDKELEKAKNRVKGDCKMNFNKYEYTGDLYGMTNVGEAILQSLEILKQEEERDSNQQKFFVLMTDGEPSTHTNIGTKRNYKFLSSKQTYLDNASITGGIFQLDDKDMAMEYVKDVADPKYGLNTNEIYNKAYIIGFSGLNSEKSKQEDIKEALEKSGNEVDVYDTKDGIELSNAFENISQNIGDIISVFEGPKKLKG